MTDVTTFTLTFGPYSAASGEVALAGAQGWVTPVDGVGRPLRLTHAATGRVIVPERVPVVIGDDGTASVPGLPHTDSPGLSPTPFRYQVRWGAHSSAPSPGSRTIAVPTEAGDEVDYDLLQPAEGTPAVAVPVGVGPVGPPGPSAYETALAQGFTGTAAEWLASLTGPPGDPGPPGEVDVEGLSEWLLPRDEAAATYMPAGTTTSAPPHAGPAFMVLEARTPTELAAAKSAGATHAHVQAFWDQGQTGPDGPVNAAATIEAIDAANDAGLQVALEVALQYPPAFVRDGVPKFKDDAGQEWDGAAGSGDQVRDWVWSALGRGYVADYLDKLFTQLDWTKVERVRLGGLQKGEIQFPGDGQSPRWWGYSEPAQTGAGLAGRMSAAPKAGHIPSAGTDWNDDDENFYAWYAQSMNNWMAWLIAKHREHFNGPIWVMHPGAGLRPRSQTPSHAEQGTNWRINASKGLDWDAQIAAYPDHQVWPYSTWADGTHFWPPAWASDVNDGNASAWYHLLRTARKYGRSGRIWGENTGGQSNADMDRVFREGAVAYGYEGLGWMSHATLVGAGGASYSNLAARIAETT